MIGTWAGSPRTTPLEIPWHFPDNSLTLSQFSLTWSISILPKPKPKRVHKTVYQYFWHSTMCKSSHYPNLIDHNIHVVHMYFIKHLLFPQNRSVFLIHKCKNEIVYTNFHHVTLTTSTKWITLCWTNYVRINITISSSFLQWQISFLSKFWKIILIITPKYLQCVYLLGISDMKLNIWIEAIQTHIISWH